MSQTGWMHVSDSIAPLSSCGSSAPAVEAIPLDGWKPDTVPGVPFFVGCKPAGSLDPNMSHSNASS